MLYRKDISRNQQEGDSISGEGIMRRNSNNRGREAATDITMQATAVG
jgi:hypothetical protein